MGRFLNADDVEYLLMIIEPISFNLFTYCENNIINNVDCFGNLPHDLFSSAKDAVKDFAILFYNISIFIRFEISSVIYGVIKKNKTYYAYTPYIIGNPHSCYPLDGKSKIKKGSFIIGFIHTHPNSNSFSTADKKFAKKMEHYI